MKYLIKQACQLQASKTCFLLFIMVVLLCVGVHAQIGDPGSGGTGGGDPDVVPIDGGLSLLVAAGVGYGVKRIKQRKQQ